MKKAAAPTTHQPRSESLLGITTVATTFLDTTWRIAVPVILFTALGIYADLHLGTKPWVTLPSVIVGFVFAVLLVKRQLKTAQKMEDK